MSDAGDSRKRKAPAFDANPRGKQMRGGKKPGKANWHSGNAWKNTQIQPGDSGIWATCDKGREAKCTAELRDLFGSYAEELYAQQLAAEDPSNDDDGDAMELDLEASIRAEVEGIKRPVQEPLFQPVKLDVQCVLFFRTRAPVEPVSFVRHICREALENPGRKRTRYAKRLTPMTLMGKATEEGLEDVARKVLAPHFHKEPPEPRKFAIRPTMRNHNLLKRDGIIQKVASIVGPGHKVDLKNYDNLIVVEAYTFVIGMSVVPSDFEELKRYNLAEIFEPTPLDLDQPKKDAKGGSAKELAAAVPEGPVAEEHPTVPVVEAEVSKGKTEEPKQDVVVGSGDETKEIASDQVVSDVKVEEPKQDVAEDTTINKTEDTK